MTSTEGKKIPPLCFEAGFGLIPADGPGGRFQCGLIGLRDRGDFTLTGQALFGGLPLSLFVDGLLHHEPREFPTDAHAVVFDFRKQRSSLGHSVAAPHHLPQLASHNPQLLSDFGRKVFRRPRHH